MSTLMRPLLIRFRRHLAISVLFVLAAGCGDLSISSMDQALSFCQDRDDRFHFQVMVPPWKHNKEYRCTSFESGKCVGTWVPTGRYVFVISDVPFVNFDSEIVTSLDVEQTTGDTASLVRQLISSEAIGVSGSVATFHGPAEDYPRAIEASDDGALAGHEVLWRQVRTFQNLSFNWYRRDLFLKGTAGRTYHLRFFSIGPLDRPEFESLISSFREGRAEDGAPYCKCRDEHDPSGPRDC
ncbi:MAG: hypothetical protein RBU30_22655 [Polyangia bacterium]|nr:hypothetical protein [Polyangia bacterium]